MMMKKWKFGYNEDNGKDFGDAFKNKDSTKIANKLSQVI